MVSSGIWKKTCTSEFFKDCQNCTSPKDECMFFQIARETILINNIHEKNMQSLLKIPKCFFFFFYYFCWELLYLISICYCFIFWANQKAEIVNEICTVFNFFPTVFHFFCTVVRKNCTALSQSELRIVKLINNFHEEN